MPADDLLYPPAQYIGLWLLIAVLLLAVVIAAVAVVLAATRPRRLAAQPAVDAAAVLGQLRGDYLARLDDVESRVRAGQLAPRRAHAELSRLMRGFVNEYSGLEAPVMTLQDLAARGVDPALVDTLGRYTYPSLFGRGAPVDPLLAAEAARRVVTEWH